MKKLILFISLLCFSLPTLSICKYSKTSNPTVGISIKSKILSDKSLPAGSILGVGTVGGGVADMKTFYDCEAGDVYAVSASPGAIEAPGVKEYRVVQFMKQASKVLVIKYQMLFQAVTFALSLPKWEVFLPTD